MNNKQRSADKKKSITYRKQKSKHISSSFDYTKLLLSSLGNSTIQRLFDGSILQTKLNINKPGDFHERQADKIAEQFINNKSSDNFQPKIDTIQEKGTSGSIIPGETEAELKNLDGRGVAINKSLRDYLEPRFGADLDNVRIHTGSTANKLAGSINARAFTTGKDIVFKDGEYQPESIKGKKLIVHELVHTLQQGAIQNVNIDQKKGIVQRTADELKAWVDDKSGCGSGNSFIQSGKFIVINKALDVTDAYWKDLSINNPDKLKQFILASKALQEKNHDLESIDKKQQEVVKNAQKSSGERLRFRLVIGPTDKKTSTVEKFIQDIISPLYSLKLPEFLVTMSPIDRQRLYDLPNAGKSADSYKAPLTWAIARTPKSVQELVNYTEYYMVSEGKLNEDIKAKTNAKIDLKRKDMVIDDKDIRLPAKKLKLATISETKKLGKTFGRYYAKAFQKKLDDNDVKKIIELGLKGITKVSDKEAIMSAVTTLAETKAKSSMDKFTKEAKAELIEEDLKKQEGAIQKETQTELEAELTAKLVKESLSATENKFTGSVKVVDDFWKKSESTQIEVIKSKAKAGPVPFTSAQSAAYHALKHYGDLKKTEDRAVDEAGQLLAYLKSSRETVKNPKSVTTKQGQLYDHPSFFFTRTVQAAKGLKDGKNQNMRAIVVVSDKAEIKIATYFRC